MTTQSIANITLTEPARIKPSADIAIERDAAIHQLIEASVFNPKVGGHAPYSLSLKIENHRLLIDVSDSQDDMNTHIFLSLRPFRSIIRDYFLMVESYNNARHLGGAKLEAIDMGRRGIHNEGAELLKDLLSNDVDIDFETARRFFTLVCVLHIGQVRGPRI